MINIGTLYGLLQLRDEFTPTLQNVSKSFASTAKDLDAMAAQLNKAGTTLTTSVTAPIVALGVAAIATGTSFIKTMNQVAAVTDASAEDFARLQAAAVEWGAKTQFSSTEAAEAMLQLGKAGFTAQQTIDALPATLQLAAAAGIGLGDAATLTSNTLKTFGLDIAELAHANDILAAAANASTIDVTDLAETFKYVGPIAKSAGFSLADVSAGAAMLGEAGIKGSMAGTALRAAMAELLNPGTKAKAALVDLGFGAEVSAKQMVPLTDVLDALHGRSDAAAISMVMFGDRGGPAMTALAERGGTALKELSATLDGAQGSAARMADAAMKGLPGAIETMKGSIETARTALLQALEPALTSGANAFGAMADVVTSRVVPAFQSLPTAMQTTLIGLTAAAAAIGPLLLVVGSLVQVIGVAAGGIGVLSGALFTFGNSVPALTARLWLMDAAGGALGMTLRGLGVAAGVAGAAFAGWQLGKWLADLKPFGDAAFSLGESFEFGAVKLLNWASGVKATDADIQAAILSHRALKDETNAVADATQKATDTSVIWGSGLPRLVEIEKTLTQELVAAKAAVAALTTDQKANIEAGIQMGISVEKIAEQLHLAKAVVDMYSDSVRASTNAAEAAAKAQQTLRDHLFGGDAIARAMTYVKALGDVKEVTNLNADAQKELADAMAAGVEALILSGRSTDQMTSTFEAFRLKATQTGRDAEAALKAIKDQAIDTTNALEGLVIVGQSPIFNPSATLGGGLTPAPFSSSLAQHGVVSYGGVPSFADGVTNFAGGLAKVHRDELLVNLPGGTSVIPSGATGGSGSISIGPVYVDAKESFYDTPAGVQRLGDKVSEAIVAKLRARGLVAA